MPENRIESFALKAPERPKAGDKNIFSFTIILSRIFSFFQFLKNKRTLVHLEALRNYSAFYPAYRYLIEI